ncbi:polysaccharide biosynthesis/export family protein [Roseobacter sp.]|uniref:polysaccharide biosynthesis/export family protein n=1 Tax=Roseobacter sp. TaxID=1907202 RepID=UPI003297155D
MKAKITRVGCALFMGALCGLTGPVHAQDYLLAKGDTVRIAFGGGRDPVEMMIDVEGSVRLLDVGRITLADHGLDDAEHRIEDAIAKVGLFVDPQVLISVVEYAPIVVAGDVATPGRFEFMPGMTIATALGLSGGTLSNGIDQFEIERARAEVEGQIKLRNLEIAATAVEIAKQRAALAGDASKVVLDGAMLRVIPAPEAVDATRMVQDAAASLAAERTLLKEAQALWVAEIGTLEDQQQILDLRLGVQREVIDTAQSELANAQSLQDRGLQTASRLSTVQQREADARARLLELESAQIAATRAIGEARRDLLRFTSNFKRDRLETLRAAQIALDESQMQYARSLDHLNLLQGDNIDALFASAGFTAQFTVASARAGRARIEGLQQDSALLPGDTLIVQVVDAALPHQAN